MNCDHMRTVPGCPSCEQAIADLLVAQASAPPPAKRGSRQIRTLAEARAVFPTVDQVSAATSIELAELKACYLLVQPEPRPEVYEYAARNRAMFSAEGLHHVSAHGCPGPPRDVLQGLEGEWARGNGCQPPPDDRVPAAWSGRQGPVIANLCPVLLSRGEDLSARGCHQMIKSRPCLAGWSTT